jgi:hypothetical protein
MPQRPEEAEYYQNRRHHNNESIVEPLHFCQFETHVKLDSRCMYPYSQEWFPRRLQKDVGARRLERSLRLFHIEYTVVGVTHDG